MAHPASNWLCISPKSSSCEVICIDQDKLLGIWEENQPKLRARIRNLAGLCAPIDDLLQDVFAKVLPKSQRLEPEYASNYLMRAVGNIARDYLKKLRPECCLVDSHSVQETPYDAYVKRERPTIYKDIIQPALNSLSSSKLEALELFLQDGTRAATARRMGIPETTLRSREVSALKDLREQLDLEVVAEVLKCYSE